MHHTKRQIRDNPFRTVKTFRTLKKYGIIGNPLGHSYSEGYFTDKFVREGIDACYAPYPLVHVEQATQLLKELDGFNVTYPYKEAILPFLNAIDPVAQTIGAVNVVSHGKGYNTDWIGFRDSLRALHITNATKALLLGTGGVSKAIQYALKDLGMEYTLVSRRLGNRKIGLLSYEEVNEQVMHEHLLIINCTPLGMSPYQEQKPDIPYHLLGKKHILYDCIYNPEKTLFLQEGEKRGCQIKNGLEMLHLQADEAWRIWRQN
jgi:shikimate dehydrogenase